MSQADLNCWRCGKTLTGVPLPVGRREECVHCTASLHVCRQCKFYDPGTSKDCREPVADEIPDKESANFCDYFQPRLDIAAQEDPAALAARRKLSALFGEKPAAGAVDGGTASASGAAPDSEADEARRKLAALFNGGKA